MQSCIVCEAIRALFAEDVGYHPVLAHTSQRSRGCCYRPWFRMCHVVCSCRGTGDRVTVCAVGADVLTSMTTCILYTCVCLAYSNDLPVAMTLGFHRITGLFEYWHMAAPAAAFDVSLNSWVQVCMCVVGCLHVSLLLRYHSTLSPISFACFHVISF